MGITREKVSTVGIRNQVTLPKLIREQAKIGNKVQAYIRANEAEKCLIITIEPPTGTYNKIKISEKGQLVIPKNLRESKGITEGTNLVFTVTREKEIWLQKLIEKRPVGKRKVENWRWTFLVEVIESFEAISGLKDLDIDGASLLLEIKNGSKYSENDLLETVKKMEKLLGTRLVVEKLGKDKLKLTPLFKK